MNLYRLYLELYTGETINPNGATHRRTPRQILIMAMAKRDAGRGQLLTRTEFYTDLKRMNSRSQRLALAAIAAIISGAANPSRQTYGPWLTRSAGWRQRQRRKLRRRTGR
jgi:hypothetical protein